MLENFYKNIDFFLGNRSDRYFGDGYLGATQSINHFEVSKDDGMEFNCLGNVKLPNLWSKKGGHLKLLILVQLTLLNCHCNV